MKTVISIIIVIITTIVAITLFLSADSLSRCSDMPSNISGCQKADVIIAVSGGDTTARAQSAIDLYKNGWADRLMFSGAAYDKSGPSNAEVMRRQAVEQGVLDSNIIVEDNSETTRQNADHTAELFGEYGISSAILVTSSYHQKRTLLEFESRAPNVEFRSHPSTGDNQWSVWWWTTPYGWYLAASEVVKIMVYYVGGSR